MVVDYFFSYQMNQKIKIIQWYNNLSGDEKEYVDILRKEASDI